jgi:hypothetical protein
MASDDRPGEDRAALSNYESANRLLSLAQLLSLKTPISSRPKLIAEPRRQFGTLSASVCEVLAEHNGLWSLPRVCKSITDAIEELVSTGSPRYLFQYTSSRRCIPSPHGGGGRFKFPRKAADPRIRAEYCWYLKLATVEKVAGRGFTRIGSVGIRIYYCSKSGSAAPLDTPRIPRARPDRLYG